MNYFDALEEVNVAALQLLLMSEDGRVVRGVKHTEPIIEGDYTIEEQQGFQGRTYFKVMPTAQLNDRLKDKGLYSSLTGRDFLTSEELDRYIEKVRQQIEFGHAELGRFN